MFDACFTYTIRTITREKRTNHRLIGQTGPSGTLNKASNISPLIRLKIKVKSNAKSEHINELNDTNLVIALI